MSKADQQTVLPPTYHQSTYDGPPPIHLAGAHQGPITVTTVVPLGRDSTHTVCPNCHAEILTSTQTTPGMIAYISGAVIALLGCFCGCCLIPCCIDDCMDVHHTCPSCKAFVGRYRR